MDGRAGAAQSDAMKDTPRQPVLLLSHEMLLPLQPLLESAYEICRLWDYPDRMASLS